MAIDALKITSMLSRPFITAGTPFTITTTFLNAHENAVEVTELFYHIPYQVQWVQEEDHNKYYAENQKRPFWIKLFLNPPWKKAAHPPGEDMSYRPIDPATCLMTILPGETGSFSFTAIVPKWLFVTGTQTLFDGYVKYQCKGESHISQFEVRFVVRPPLFANIIGAVMGGILGTTARYLKEVPVASGGDYHFGFWTASALAVILGIIMVVFSSKRSGDVQPILTIEDIWGGIIAGFLVGYLGHEFFGQVVTIGTPGK